MKSLLFRLMMLFMAISMLNASEKADIIVALDGTGDFTSVQEAVNSIPPDNKSLKIILIRKGSYEEKIRIDTDYIALVGEDRDSTRIHYYEPYVWDSVYVDIGQAVINIHANDITLANLTAENTQPDVGIHAFTVYGTENTRTIIINCNILSNGGDTIALWNGDTGMYYHNTCFFKGAVDFLCPRGWCYAENIEFYCTRSTTLLWHDGSKNKDQKFVVKNSTFDGANSFILGRNHWDGAFYLINLVFSEKMRDEPFTRPESSEAPYKWGRRYYFQNCIRPAGNYDWFKNNMITAEGSPNPEDVTPAWTFAGKWNPEESLPSVLPFAFLPKPGNGQIRVSTQPMLSWVPGRNAQSHNVYFGTAPDPDFIGNTMERTFQPGQLLPDSIYFWRVDEVTDEGIIEGDLWHFRTQTDQLPPKAVNPFPADGAADVEGPIDRLLWEADSLKTDFSRFYFGEDPDSLELLSQYSVPGFYHNQLKIGKHYYWRVDVENHMGRVQGDLWQFTMKPSAYSRADYFQSETDGIVSIEAEHFTENIPMGDHTWTLTSEFEGYSGEGAMQALPDEGTFFITGYAENCARLDYSVEFNNTGTYYIWIRGLTQGGSDNLFHMGLNDEEVYTASRIGNYQTQNQWEWINGSAVQNPEIRSFDVGILGIQKVSLWFGRDGALADKILLTTNPDYIPRGSGPEQTVGIKDFPEGKQPADFELKQNYPNPFNGSTCFEYQIPGKSRVQLDIFDILGKKVRSLIDEVQEAGRHAVYFDSDAISSGIYLARLRSSDAVIIRRIAHIK